MARSWTVMVHFERDDGSVSYSTASGSTLTSVVADGMWDAEQKAEEKVRELEGHSFDIV